MAHPMIPKTVSRNLGWVWFRIPIFRSVIGESLLGANLSAPERVQEPRLGAGVIEDRRRRLVLRGEKEEAEARRVRRRGEVVVLVEHVVEVLVGSDGDEGVEVVAWELVLEDEGGMEEEGGGEVGGEGGQGGGGAVDGDNAGVPTGVGEGLVVGAGDNVAAVAAHQAELGTRHHERG